MSRKHRHEEHENHEAWAIPYGDLITLLLAFFVVMYAISTVNEGKYRALSDSLSSAFKGSPRSPDPIEVGDRATAAHQDEKSRLDPQGNLIGTEKTMMQLATGDSALKEEKKGPTRMDDIVGRVEQAMSDQILQQTIKVHRTGNTVEIEIGTDSLFPSGSASMTTASTPVMAKLADTLKDLTYPMRVEGHTDNRPISTALFPSNWELSAARAATVVHLFTQRGVDPSRLTVMGFGEFRPQTDNSTDAGRNANRRVRVIIMSDGEHPEEDATIKDVAGEANEANTAATVTTETTPATNAAPAATTATPAPAAAPAASAPVKPATGNAAR